MAHNKKQHIIPNCYLKSWCDPNTPAGQSPYIWRISKDGVEKIKRSPEKSFTETDKYTIKMPNGQRNLIVENTLARIENDFMSVLRHVRRREKLGELQRARLCAFAAAMLTRTTSMGEHWKRQQQQLHDQVVALEKHHGGPPITSSHTAKMVEHAQHLLIAQGIEVQLPLLFEMSMTIFVTNDNYGFITSDNPCVWFNPKAYKMPPFYRSPGLAQQEIEVTLPLTPSHMLLISHREHPHYVDVSQNMVDEANRLRRFHCDKEFVSWKGETRPYWFDPGTEPEDSWEKSPEGRHALEEHNKMLGAAAMADEAIDSKNEG